MNVTVNQLYYNTLTIGACTGDSVYAGGSYQTTSGTFVDSLQSVNGCDSVVQTNLTIASQIVANIPLSVCFGDSALINGNYESANGTFYDTTLSLAGCDSITITNFTVENLNTNSVNANVCFGDSLLVGGAYQTVSGTYVDTLITSAGCDSLVTTTLTVNTTSISTDTQQAACDFTWIDGVTYTASDSSATYTLSSVAGCDSVVTLNLTISAIITTIVQNVNDIEATATNGAAPYNFEWNTGETTATITPSANGTYWLMVSDADSCFADTATFNVTFVSGTGILTIDNVFNIYPNPTNDLFNIESKGNNQYISTTVYDIFGKKLITTTNSKISLKNFEDGVYIVEINNGNSIYTSRIIKH